MNFQSIFKTTWQCPSNIALVKYWGKKDNQIPCNPSISFTLDNAFTETQFILNEKQSEKEIELLFNFENQRNDKFELKILNYFEKIVQDFPWLKNYQIVIFSKNTFPHSSGIASSASAFGALALCLCSADKFITQKDFNFYQKASYFARLGSGSACRSLYGGYNLWGKTDSISNSSDEYSIEINSFIHSNFNNLNDYVILVEKGQKKVSSTKGHALLKEHPFAENRYQMAYQNISKMLDILNKGNLNDFINLVEYEALVLHSLMMSSPEPFILMKPETLRIITKIQEYRKENKIPFMFTLDAGANIHFIFPDEFTEQAESFLRENAQIYLSDNKIVRNKIGKGPKQIL